MINPQELRLNNWISNFGEMVQIGEIRMEDNEFQPIPLTPEILEAAGLKGEYDTLIFTNGDIRIKLDDNCAYIWSGLGDARFYGFNTELKYLHHLQNLFFALTGEELTIKL